MTLTARLTHRAAFGDRLSATGAVDSPASLGRTHLTPLIMIPTSLRLLALLSLLSVAVAAEKTAESPAATKAEARKFTVIPLGNPRAVAVDREGNLYVGEVDSGAVFKLTLAGTFSNITGSSSSDPIGVALDRKGVIYIADADGNATYKVTGSTVAPFTKPAVPGKVSLATPTSIVVDSAGNAFVTNNGDNTIVKIAPDGAVSTFAGKIGTPGNTDGTGETARFSTPRGIAIDGDDNLYVADEGAGNVRKLTPKGVVTTLASGFNAPRALAADAKGTVYIADTDAHAIRKISPDGKVTLLAGKIGTAGKEDGTGEAAHFSEPRGIAIDPAGNVYVADTGNASIRQITPAGVVTTIAAAEKP